MTPRPLELLQLSTPVGPLAVLTTPEDGVVRAAGFGPVESLLMRLTPDLRARATAPGPADGPVATAVLAYVDGDHRALDAVPVAQPGGPFLQQAWAVLREVPPGSVVSYAQLAARAGRPAATRAAGMACSRNLVVPFIPCHRVVKSGGTTGQYLYGTTLKQQLLLHEGYPRRPS